MCSWVAVFQFLVCIPLAVPATLAGDPAISPLELPKNLWDGWMCYLGYNSVMIGEHPDNCWPDSPLYVTLYLMVNITYNILITLVRAKRQKTAWSCLARLLRSFAAPQVTTPPLVSQAPLETMRMRPSPFCHKLASGMWIECAPQQMVQQFEGNIAWLL